MGFFFQLRNIREKQSWLIHLISKKEEVVEVQEVQAPEVQGMEVPVQKAAQPIPEIKKARPSVHWKRLQLLELELTLVTNSPKQPQNFPVFCGVS